MNEHAPNAELTTYHIAVTVSACDFADAAYVTEQEVASRRSL